MVEVTQNPYRGLDDAHFWARSVAMAAPGQVDPMLGAHPISHDARVVTIGSCFAQHLARHLGRLGLRHHIIETAPDGMAKAEADRHQYGVFSVRCGNIYTARQALQLHERAFGRFRPVEDVWARDGGFVDAFRPQVTPEPFGSEDEVRRAAAAHLASVREMFETADWLILTLGLTEAWRSSLDGAVYPVAPGVAGGGFDPGRHEFVNFSAEAVKHDLVRLVTLMREYNPGCHIILTVSPVPLIATYSDRHVLTATTYSKAVLRVAAEEVCRLFGHVRYFPSFEIITSPAANYFEDDLRSVSEVGVGHVMRVFRRHFVRIGQHAAAPDDDVAVVPVTSVRENAPKPVICDEELIEASVRAVARVAPELPPLALPDGPAVPVRLPAAVVAARDTPPELPQRGLLGRLFGGG